MADGAKLERFASRTVAQEPSVFASNPVIAGFLVDDIEQARDELSRTPGVELLESCGSCRTDTPGWSFARRTGTCTNSSRNPGPPAEAKHTLAVA
jgi:hypothetical protein